MGYPSHNCECFDFGQGPDPATEPHCPHPVLSGPLQGQWLLTVPGQPPIYRDTAPRADAVFGWLLAFWRSQAHFEEVHGDLYDVRSHKRLRHGYRELFYQINDGHQLRATLRFLEDNREGSRFVFYTDEGTAVCRHCVREQLRDLTFALRHYDEYALRVVGTELRYTEPLRCECCDEEIPVI